jgi:hypothetical protein
MATPKNKKKKEKPTPSASPVTKPPLVVPYDLADNIIGYLGTRPYQEVNQFIAGLLRCAPKLRKE